MTPDVSLDSELVKRNMYICYIYREHYRTEHQQQQQHQLHN